jgi:hypothetical protein
MARLLEFYMRPGVSHKSPKPPAGQMGKLIAFPGMKIKKSA